MNFQPTVLAQLATKDNFEEVSLERSQIQIVINNALGFHYSGFRILHYCCSISDIVRVGFCVRIVCVEYGARFFESKREWGGRGVKEKNHNQVLNNEAAKDVADGKDSGFVDPKVVEGVDESVSTIPNFFTSLVTNEAITCKASILDVHSRYGFSLYGYFVGKRVAFPVVENYVKNDWKKFGLVRVMMNSKGILFFKFDSIEGMNGVFENGPRFIRYAPIILKKWTPNVYLLKEDLNSVPILLNFHINPIVAYTTDGLSVMATKLGNPIMLHSYTSSMCLQSWGCMDYARALIDIRADRELKEDMVIAIPNVEYD
uniref:DUF4283 domain-containing protein n=1 Tax=Tanacetum cinerariifolium TaxID=118510 RepID=A0A6L2NLN0_TANCI|nr:hypothetical protein [Tanacetum cinerariifolium]